MSGKILGVAINTNMNDIISKDAQLLSVLGLNSFNDLLNYMDECRVAIDRSLKLSNPKFRHETHNDAYYEDINARRYEFMEDWFDYEEYCLELNGGRC